MLFVSRKKKTLHPKILVAPAHRLKEGSSAYHTSSRIAWTQAARPSRHAKCKAFSPEACLSLAARTAARGPGGRAVRMETQVSR